MNFSDALTAAKTGALISRAGWTGTKVYVSYTAATTFTVVDPPLSDRFAVDDVFSYDDQLHMHFSTGNISLWNASQDDLLATDWDNVSPA